MSRFLAVVFALLSPVASAAAQDASRSECLAMASAPPRATPVSLRRLAAKADEVAITYAGHSPYYIDTPGGVRIATDYSGAYVGLCHCDSCRAAFRNDDAVRAGSERSSNDRAEIVRIFDAIQQNNQAWLALFMVRGGKNIFESTGLAGRANRDDSLMITRSRSAIELCAFFEAY